MRTLVCLIEEPSAEEMLKGILPKILPENVLMEFKIFEGKQDMQKRLLHILKAWQKPDCLFLVMRDRDAGDCYQIKTDLAELCEQSGKHGVLIRVVCRELETFYLGDLAAVENGLGVSGLIRLQNTRKFRNPDALDNPAEERGKLTNRSYQKISGSRAIGPHLNIENNRSHSFNVLIAGIRKLLEDSSV